MSNPLEHVVITVSGPDKVGIADSILQVISIDDVEIIDLGQSSTHGILSMSVVLKISLQNDAKQQLYNNLKKRTADFNLGLQFEVITDKLDAFFPTKGVNMAINCVSMDRLTPSFLQQVTAVLKQNDINIYRIDNLSGIVFHSLEMIVVFPSSSCIEKVKNKLFAISKQYSVDVALIEDNIYRRNKRLIVFDMDSTLILEEVIDEMAREKGVLKEVADLTDKAMNDKLEYKEALQQRLALLKGLTVKQMKGIATRLTYSPGVKELISTVKALGYKIALISGGFTFFAHRVQQDLNIDYVYANQLEIKDDKLTGKVIGNIIDAEKKAEILEKIAIKEKISLKQVLAVGDGANDIRMLSKAGLGIAYHAKEVVRKKTSYSMSYAPMNSILYFLGIPKVSHFVDEKP